MNDLSVSGLRRLNLRESTGSFGRSSMPLDDLVIGHLMQVRALERLNAYEECYCRMAVEGFSVREIAAEMGVSVRQVGRLRTRLQGTLYGEDLRDALSRAA